MLSRAALRVIRPHQIRPNVFATSVTASRLRYYAKNNKPSHQTPKPSSAYAPSSQSSPAKRFLDAQKAKAAPSPSGPSSSQAAAKDGEATSDANVRSKIVEEDIPKSDPAEEVTADTPQSQPLPDLRRGIPSTFEAEFGKQDFGRAASEKPQEESHDPNITEDPANPNPIPGSGNRGTGELPKSAYETSTDRRRNAYMNYTGLLFVLFGGAGAAYYGRNWETPEEERAHPEAPSGWNLNHFWKRINARWSNQLSYYTEPSFPKLLPDMEAPYTLVLSLSDLLIHSEWTRENGWRTAKRPGLDYFLRYLCQYYEIVVFTDLPSAAADPIIKKLDPLRMVIMWPLFREATRYENGEYIKDLSYLNRDLSKVIMIDTKQSHAKLQPENSIVLKPWKGTPNDKGLVNLIPFLEYIATMGVPDVRTAIKSFEGKDIPEEFARREALAREAFNKQLEEERAKKPKRSGASFLMSALGMKPQAPVTADGINLADGFAQGKMLSDQARERGQKQYELMEKEIRENGEKWLKEMEAEEKKMQEEWMKGMKSSFSLKGMIGGETPSQPRPESTK